MAVVKRQRAVDQSHSHRILKIHVRHRSIIDNPRAIFRQAGDNSFDVVHRKAVLPAKRDECVQRRLDRITYGEHLYRCLGDEESFAESRDHLFRLRLTRKRDKSIVLSIENIRHTGKSGLRHNCRRHSIARTHAGEIECLLHMLEIPFPTPDSRYLLRRVRQRVTHSLFIEPCK